MNLQTPINEVAAYLPREAAQILEFQPVDRQAAVLTVVRRAVVEWEQNGVVMDPLTLAAVLTTLVREIMGLYIALLSHLQGGDFDPIDWGIR